MPRDRDAREAPACPAWAQSCARPLLPWQRWRSQRAEMLSSWAAGSCKVFIRCSAPGEAPAKAIAKAWTGGCFARSSSKWWAPLTLLTLAVCSLSTGSFGKLEETGVWGKANMLSCYLLPRFTWFSSALDWGSDSPGVCASSCFIWCPWENLRILCKPATWPLLLCLI